MLLLVGANVLGGASDSRIRLHALASVGAGGSDAAAEARRDRRPVRQGARVDSALSIRIADSIAPLRREQALAPDLVLAVMLRECSGRPGAQQRQARSA